MIINNKELQLADDLLQFTGTSIFLTGKAGTGKTTFLHNLKIKSPKRMIVLAPTGVAAINAGGVTIHSFFQLPFCPHIPTLIYQDEKGAFQNTDEMGNHIQRSKAHKFNKDKIKILKSVDLIIIDEISMVRADILDAVDEILRRYRQSNKPFGGVQMLFIGDVKQLAPVAKEEEWNLIKEYYNSPYFFSSHAFRRSHFLTIELVEIFRQNDKKFIDLLNNIRNNILDDESISILNEKYDPTFSNDKNKGYITLTSHNFQAKQINSQQLSKINYPKETFYAEIDGDFPEYSYPTDEELIIKIGAQVMFVKNDPSPDKKYFNGKIGIVEDIYKNKIYVKCGDSDENIQVQPLEWTNVRYAINSSTNEIYEDIQGTFKQYPLKLAWAITIHKSQGLTFDKLAIDAQMSFAHGQVYVALSRCKTLDGLVLISKIDKYALKNDYSVAVFENEIEQRHANEEKFLILKREYFFDLLSELFCFNHLFSSLKKLQKLYNLHLKNIFPSHIEKLNLAIIQFQNEIIIVTEKFNIQLKTIIYQHNDYEDNPFVTDRYIKASEYFNKTLEKIMNFIFNSDIEVDNKEISKIINKAFDELSAEYNSKKYLLEYILKHKFDIQSFLKIKAEVELKTKETKKRKKNNSKEVEYSDIKYPKLYTLIRLWREAEAAVNNLEPYNVLIQRSLIEICYYLPETKEDLLKIHGIGKVTLNKYGDEILEIIKEYIDEYGR
ncbi:MAG: AAA family ATPase [Bacteroidales bacterium]|jgi:hypothetical protein|nr:AAA family ATPase [Bacteroidales bacterium]